MMWMLHKNSRIQDDSVKNSHFMASFTVASSAHAWPCDILFRCVGTDVIIFETVIKYLFGRRSYVSKMIIVHECQASGSCGS